MGGVPSAASAADQLQAGHHAERTVEPATLGHAVEVRADHERLGALAAQHRPQVAGLVLLDLDRAAWRATRGRTPGPAASRASTPGGGCPRARRCGWPARGDRRRHGRDRRRSCGSKRSSAVRPQRSEVGEGLLLAQPAGGVVDAHRAGDVEALRPRAAELLQQRQLLLGVDAFGDDLQAQRVAEAQQQLDDGAVEAVVAPCPTRRPGRSSARRPSAGAGSSSTSSRCRSRRWRRSRPGPQVVDHDDAGASMSPSGGSR